MHDKNAIIGNYRILSPIASGAFGRVYLAQHQILTRRIVALKLMHALPFSSEQDPQLFIHEAQILELLKHPSILPILDAGLHEDIPYIVSAYASGNSLRKRFQDHGSQPFPLDNALTWLWQIGQALQYAHDRQVIHRDIKPENILFSAEDKALLADFGLATLLTATSVKQVTNAGTPRYMAPEQFQGIISKASDQYALGCIAYELFTGHSIFEVSDSLAFMYAHNYTLPTPLTNYNPSLPAHIEQAVLTALMKDRNQRHPDINTFLALLQASDNSLTLKREILEPQSIASQLSQEQQEVSESDIATLLKMFPKEAGSQTDKSILLDSTNSISPAIHTSHKQQTDKSILLDLTNSISPAIHTSHKEIALLPEAQLGKTPEITRVYPQHSQALAQEQIARPHHHQGSIRWFRLIACIVIAISVSSSLFLAWQTMATHNQAQTRGNTLLRQITSTSTQFPLAATPTTMPTSSYIHTPTAQPPSTSTPQVQSTPTSAALVQPTSTPRTQATPTSKPLHTVSYYVCGDQASLTDNNYWHTVQPNDTVSTSDYSGPVNGYKGPSGSSTNSPGNCSGLYHWAWDQNPVQAMWTWTNAYLPSGTCRVSIHIPSWYSGAPDAQYSLNVSSSTSNNSYAFSPQNQNQLTTTWVSLLINHQAQAISLPRTANNTYTLTLTLTNGGATNWYLGADAIQFDCTYRA